MAERKQTSETNITPAHKAAFQALSSGQYANFALFSCFVNGEPAAAIVTVGHDGSIAPLFVSVTPGMALMDHDGIAPTNSKAAERKAWAEARAEIEQSIAQGHEHGRGNSR